MITLTQSFNLFQFINISNITLLKLHIFVNICQYICKYGLAVLFAESNFGSYLVLWYKSVCTVQADSHNKSDAHSGDFFIRLCRIVC